jgi:DNA-binding NarL/FixJ family response regulator
MKIRVCICEDDPVFRNLLLDYINKEPDITVIGITTSKTELLDFLKLTKVDVLLLDMNLSGDDQGGLDAALEIQWLGLDIKIIVLSSFDEDQIISDAMTFGRVCNYIIKEHYRDISGAIREAYVNQSGIHHSSAHHLLQQLISSQEEKLKSSVTKLQIQILQLLSEGEDRKQIAEQLFYTDQTIKNEIFKVSKLLKGKLPYLERLGLKRQNTKVIVDLARRLRIIP